MFAEAIRKGQRTAKSSPPSSLTFLSQRLHFTGKEFGRQKKVSALRDTLYIPNVWVSLSQVLPFLGVVPLQTEFFRSIHLEPNGHFKLDSRSVLVNLLPSQPSCSCRLLWPHTQRHLSSVSVPSCP